MTFTLKEKKEETSDVTTFIFEPSEPLAWEAGQLMHYTLPHDDADDRGIERWFTISSAPFEKHPSITTRFAGIKNSEKSSSFKKALFALPIGATIEADGVEGEFTVTDPEHEYVFIAGGIGITPFHSILKELDHHTQPIQVTLLYANRTDEAVFRTELDAIASRNQDFTIHYITDPERIDEETIRTHVPDLATPTFYVSGPEAMVAVFVKMLGDMGIPEHRVKHDFFPGYGTAYIAS